VALPVEAAWNLRPPVSAREQGNGGLQGWTSHLAALAADWDSLPGHSGGVVAAGVVGGRA
jgi:hypothetical protein